MPSCLIIGDTKSQDMICCRVAHYKQTRTCYACYTPFENLSCHLNKCQLVHQNEQHLLLEGCMEDGMEADDHILAGLRKDSTFHLPCSIWTMVVIPLGQFGACTLDLMHAFEAGTCRDVSKCFIDPMPPRQKEKLDDRRLSMRALTNKLLQTVRRYGTSQCGQDRDEFTY